MFGTIEDALAAYLNSHIDLSPRYTAELERTIRQFAEWHNTIIHLSLRWDDVDYDACTLLIRAPNHKLRRDKLLWLPASAMRRIRRLPSHRRRLVWDWPYGRRWFFVMARRIIERAGVPCPKRGNHLFHRLRRTSGTLVEANGGDGARHLGNSRSVFERHYLDARRLCGQQAARRPVPALPAAVDRR